MSTLAKFSVPPYHRFTEASGLLHSVGEINSVCVWLCSPMHCPSSMSHLRHFRINRHNTCSSFQCSAGQYSRASGNEKKLGDVEGDTCILWVWWHFCHRAGALTQAPCTNDSHVNFCRSFPICPALALLMPAPLTHIGLPVDHLKNDNGLQIEDTVTS